MYHISLNFNKIIICRNHIQNFRYYILYKATHSRRFLQKSIQNIQNSNINLILIQYNQAWIQTSTFSTQTPSQLAKLLAEERHRSNELTAIIQKLQREFNAQQVDINIQLKAEQEKNAALAAALRTRTMDPLARGTAVSVFQKEKLRLMSRITILEQELDGPEQARCKDVAEVTERYTREIDLLTQNLLNYKYESRKEIERLEHRVRELEKELADSNQQRRLMERKMKEIEEDGEGLEALQIENNELRRQLADVEYALEQNRKQLKKANYVMEEQFSQRDEVNDEILYLQEQIKLLQDENSLILRSANTKNRKIDELQQQLQSNTTDVDALQDDFQEQLQKKCRSYEKKIERLEGKIEFLRERNNELLKQINSLSEDNIKSQESLQESRKQLTLKIQNLKQILSETREQLHEKELAISKAKEQVRQEMADRIQSLKAENQELKQQLTEIQDQIEIARQSSAVSFVNELGDLDSFRHSSNTPFDKLKRENERLQKQLDALSAEIADVQFNSRDSITQIELETELDLARAECGRLETIIISSHETWTHENNVLRQALEEAEKSALFAQHQLNKEMTEKEAWKVKYHEVAKVKKGNKLMRFFSKNQCNYELIGNCCNPQNKGDCCIGISHLLQNFVQQSLLPVANRCPKGCQAISLITPACAASIYVAHSSKPTTQQPILPSNPPDTKSSLWNGCQISELTSLICYLNTCISYNILKSYNLICVSLEAVKKVFPSKLQRTLVTALLCACIFPNSLELLGSQSFTRLSLLPVAISALQGCHSQHFTSHPCPANARSSHIVAKSQIFPSLSSEQDTNFRLSPGEQLRSRTASVCPDSRLISFILDLHMYMLPQLSPDIMKLLSFVHLSTRTPWE